jgi:hypothetical protein
MRAMDSSGRSTLSLQQIKQEFGDFLRFFTAFCNNISAVLQQLLGRRIAELELADQLDVLRRFDRLLDLIYLPATQLTADEIAEIDEWVDSL